jgi:hypothetical protein
VFYYRLYFLDRRSGHINAFTEIDAVDDQAAVGLANAQVGERPLELWCEGRKVRRIEAVRTVSASLPVSP